MHAVGAGRAKQFDAYWESAREEIVATTEVAIRAYLSAMKEDPEVVERVARAIYEAAPPNTLTGPLGFDLACACWPEGVEAARKKARTALSAIEVE